jgi:Arylsulfotransferase (ASST)
MANNNLAGSGFILDDAYGLRLKFPMTEAPDIYSNMHEFRIINDGRSVLLIVGMATPNVSDRHPSAGPIGSNGFREIDIATGKILFDWRSLEHIEVSESMVELTTHHSINDYL